jgi:hypothetical protein
VNTKERHLEILGVSERVVEEAGGPLEIDDLDQVSHRAAFLELAKCVASETGCHISAAKRNVATALRRARYRIMKERAKVEGLFDLIEEAEWGGKRPGAGPPRGNKNQNWAKRRASSDK